MKQFNIIIDILLLFFSFWSTIIVILINLFILNLLSTCKELNHYIAEIGRFSQKTGVIHKQTLAWAAQKGGKNMSIDTEYERKVKKKNLVKIEKNLTRKWKSTENE
jgi:hypothetical protein